MSKEPSRSGTTTFVWVLCSLLWAGLEHIPCTTKSSIKNQFGSHCPTLSSLDCAWDRPLETKSVVSVTARLKVELDKTSSWSAGWQHTQSVSQWHQKEETKTRKMMLFQTWLKLHNWQMKFCAALRIGLMTVAYFTSLAEIKLFELFNLILN